MAQRAAPGLAGSGSTHNLSTPPARHAKRRSSDVSVMLEAAFRGATPPSVCHIAVAVQHYVPTDADRDGGRNPFARSESSNKGRIKPETPCRRLKQSNIERTGVARRYLLPIRAERVAAS